ncbi:MAG TPA: dihydrolipoamide acyltransferase, partial [Planctomycetaceae bacterium]|nr:dihydrolipoamide acyltransferase [Planctomycetaceae bacterium]
MAIEIIVPRLGWSMDEGIFSQWLVQDGDMVHEGDAL